MQNGIIKDLAAIVGADAVLTDAASCDLYAQDIYTRALPALAVVRPATAAQLAQVVGVATRSGHAVIARGGGMSYTSGYVPAEPDSIMIDMGRLNQVTECNTEDMYVTVEAGCTWKALHESLQGTGYRTPYWGTLSGISATVGGGLSQNSIFWGSGRHGCSVDSVLSLEVALADGALLNTGANAQRNSSPFFRHYGPDLTGLFCCDSGALGIKTKATLRLIPELSARRFASFDFNHHADMIKAMSAIARAELAMECFGFDPFLQKQRLQRESLMKDVKALAGVIKASGGVGAALREGVKTALAGRSFMDDVSYSLHLMVEENSETQAEQQLDKIRRLCLAQQGREIENSIPKILRANPFTPLNNIVGPQGERWAPIHALVPHSKAGAVMDGIETILAQQEETLQREEIGVGFLFATVATHCFVIEPVFFWPDAMTAIHRDTIEPDVLKKLPGFEENPAAREAVATLEAGPAGLLLRDGRGAFAGRQGLPVPTGIAARELDVVARVEKSAGPGSSHQSRIAGSRGSA